jgi:16S rRNA (guanine966-N2)-methyltransferase
MGKVREALFSMLQARGLSWPGARVLDLFAGSGSLGFEALSRGAAFACFVESAPYAARVIKANAAMLGADGERMRLCLEDAGRFLARPADQVFSLVFIDPPYGSVSLKRVLSALIGNSFVAPGAFVNAEVELGVDFEPENIHPALRVRSDRSYGQTRLILWETRET